MPGFTLANKALPVEIAFIERIAASSSVILKSVILWTNTNNEAVSLKSQLSSKFKRKSKNVPLYMAAEDPNFRQCYRSVSLRFVWTAGLAHMLFFSLDIIALRCPPSFHEFSRDFVGCLKVILIGALPDE